MIHVLTSNFCIDHVWPGDHNYSITFLTSLLCYRLDKFSTIPLPWSITAAYLSPMQYHSFAALQYRQFRLSDAYAFFLILTSRFAFWVTFVLRRKIKVCASFAITVAKVFEFQARMMYCRCRWYVVTPSTAHVHYKSSLVNMNYCAFVFCGIFSADLFSFKFLPVILLSSLVRRCVLVSHVCQRADNYSYHMWIRCRIPRRYGLQCRCHLLIYNIINLLTVNYVLKYYLYSFELYYCKWTPIFFLVFNNLINIFHCCLVDP